ncbi:hypothetical protein ACJX0J_006183, partial [Zea mays]
SGYGGKAASSNSKMMGVLAFYIYVLLTRDEIRKQTSIMLTIQFIVQNSAFSFVMAEKRAAALSSILSIISQNSDAEGYVDHALAGIANAFIHRLTAVTSANKPMWLMHATPIQGQSAQGRRAFMFFFNKSIIELKFISLFFDGPFGP